MLPSSPNQIRVKVNLKDNVECGILCFNFYSAHLMRSIRPQTMTVSVVTILRTPDTGRVPLSSLSRCPESVLVTSTQRKW